MNYRREIDGLRAVAVMPVIFFHGGVPVFSGGYVGVDVFFVISGYLITTIILGDLQAGRFSLLSFYERRARRILPALTFVVLCCFPTAWFLLMPEELIYFSQSAISVSTFSSNFLFMKRDYFSAAAELLPLLHTWSLAVEEQYYILFPLLLMLMWRFGRKRIVMVLAVLFIASLALAQWAAYNKPVEAFFLLLTRGWELAIGSFCALYLGVSRDDFGEKTSNALSFLGLLFILAAVFGFTEDTLTPSIYTLMPTVGTGMIILFATPMTWVGQILGKKVLVAVGLISYSAYLWHQPLFAFSRHAKTTELTTFEVLVLVVLVFLLATISWRFVESPFRQQGFLSQSKVFAVSFASLAAIIAGSIYLSHGDANFRRFDANQQMVLRQGAENRILMTESAYDRFRCFFNGDQQAAQLVELECIPNDDHQKAILFGDSEAAHLREGLMRVLKPYDVSFGQFTGAGCRAMDYPGNSNRCSEFYELFFDEMDSKLGPDDIVFVASNWWNTHRKMGDADFATRVAETLSRIKERGAVPVLVLNAPDFLKNPYEMAVKTEAKPGSDWYFETEDYSSSDRVLVSVAAELRVQYFTPSDYLCKEDRHCLFKRKNEYFYFDPGHFSYYGSLKIAELMLDALGSSWRAPTSN